MSAQIGEALRPAGGELRYEYDFGSTTTLAITAVGERRGRIGRPAVRLLARNSPPALMCARCGKPATFICPYCLGESNGLVCDAHRSAHQREDEEAFLPVVNSPRMGVCGYTGGA
jgi:hypothetical protein